VRSYLLLGGILETLVMGLVLLGAARRWPSLDRGARRVVAGVAVFFGYALIALPLVLLGVRTTQIREIPQLIGSLCLLGGFLSWQPKPGQRRVVRAGVAIYLALWVVSQVVQGLHSEFSPISQPLRAFAITAAAGFTLVTRVQVGSEQWTAQLWFWFAVGSMVVHGMDAILEPLMINMFGVRNDLVAIAFGVQLLAGCAGYGLMASGLFRQAAPAPGYALSGAGR
jgi:hypothetical protein